jgi:hypothetical protein
MALAINPQLSPQPTAVESPPSTTRQNANAMASTQPQLSGDRVSPPYSHVPPPFMRMQETMETTAIPGAFALQDGAAATQGHLIAQADPHNLLNENIKFWLNPSSSPVPITNYQMEMTKYAHVIIVSDDFKTFMHVHPTLLPDGQFVIHQTFPQPGRYHIYADTVPDGMPQQVFRFDVNVGRSNRSAASPLEREDTSPSLVQHDGAYSVVLDKTTVKAGQTSMIRFTIYDHGHPAEHLQPFLGVGAHAILLNANDLSYMHTHPMPMSMGMDTGMSMDQMMKNMPVIKPGDHIDPSMMLHVKLDEPGIYRMWLQFKDQNQQLRTVSYIVSAR